MANNWKKLSISAIVLIVMIAVPIFVDLGTGIMNQLVTLFIYILLAEGWNLIGGYTGQINLGMAAFFGCSVMVTHFMWVAGVPIIISILVGSLSTIILAVIIGIPTLRLKGMYFAVGTLALAQALQVIMQNIFNRSIAAPGNFVQAFNLTYRYYLGLALVVLVLAVVYLSAIPN